VQKTKEEIVGDPMDTKTTVGPLVRENQRHALIRQVADAKSKGAEILLGGRIVEDTGYYYEPTVISNVNHQMEVLREEVFGPAAPIIVVENEIEAITEANNSEFGLGASIWTCNLCEAAHIPVILATQILESLAESGLRSRAEIADAIIGQRAECVMLNNGPHILQAIETLSRLLGKEERLRHQIKKLPIFRDFTEQYAVFEA